MSVGVLDRVFDIVDKIKLTNNATQINIPFAGPGLYIIIPYPVVTKQEALAPGNAYTFAAGSFLYAETISAFVATSSSTFNSSGQLGYWNNMVEFTDSTHQTIRFRPSSNSSVTMIGGRTYYILKPKS